ncbi:unnamed protein product [Blepharisma stoltei]|uniref:Uncharacterized protein n=1 Tax=Blepharisma stoltei TaxID=1481888 RepID=A0AAU9IDL8_9CILI|nr:unnamed protein product [Blepharisma stoltei]
MARTKQSGSKPVKASKTPHKRLAKRPAKKVSATTSTYSEIKPKGKEKVSKLNKKKERKSESEEEELPSDFSESNEGSDQD